MELFTGLVLGIVVLLTFGAAAIQLSKNGAKSISFDLSDADLEQMTKASIEMQKILQIVAQFKMSMLDLNDEVAHGHISEKDAPDLVLKQKAEAFDQIYKTIVLGVRSATNEVPISAAASGR